MSTKHEKRLAPLHLLALWAVAALAPGCGQGDSARAPVSEDEYDIVKRQQQDALENGPMPIAEAMAQYGSTERDEFAALVPQPSADESAVNGWSFKGAAPIAAGDVTMPPECVGAANPEACWGQKLSMSKGCVACHAVDGVKQQPCPNWKGLFGAERPLVSGETVVADEAYLANSIVNSWDQVVQGYGKTMPPYKLPEQELGALVAYLKSLGEGG